MDDRSFAVEVLDEPEERPGRCVVPERAAGAPNSRGIAEHVRLTEAMYLDPCVGQGFVDRWRGRKGNDSMTAKRERASACMRNLRKAAGDMRMIADDEDGERRRDLAAARRYVGRRTKGGEHRGKWRGSAPQ